MDPKTVHIVFNLNGRPQALEIPGAASALRVIRDLIGLKGTKEGCGIGECGACTIEVDGKAVNSCLMLAAQLDGTEVLTVEGLASGDGLHPLQTAFLNHHGVQCGFCTPGLLMSTHALLKETPHPDRAQVSKAIAGNLCRCTGYQHIFASIDSAINRTGEAS
jgi:aerobic-type carbon monoxide dehydrogenase small subunit (CoxS/CutS family)